MVTKWTCMSYYMLQMQQLFLQVFIYGCLGPWHDTFPLEINYLDES
jgi:hypothetical protein